MTTCENHKHTIVCFHAPQFECPLCRAEADLGRKDKENETFQILIDEIKKDLNDVKQYVQQIQCS